MFQQPKPYYNEGNRISSYADSIWTSDFTGDPVTPTHAPWCGYWHTGPYDNKGVEFPSNDYYPEPVGDPCIKDPNIAWDYEESASVVTPNSNASIAITGLNTPFVWEITGVGFSLGRIRTTGLTNTLIVGNTACGSATITVTGCDDEQTVGYVRSTIGLWGPDQEGCRMGGSWDTQSSRAFTKILGNIRQIQMISPTINAGHHCGEGPCAETCAVFGNFLSNCLSISCVDYEYSEPSCGGFCCGDPCNNGICWQAAGEPCQEDEDCSYGSCTKAAKCKCTVYVRYNIWGCP